MDSLNQLLQNLGYACRPVSPEEAAAHKCASFNSEAGKLTGYDCPACKNKGIIMTCVERNGTWEFVTRDCECMETRRTLNRLEQSGLKDAISTHTFETFETNFAWQKTMLLKAISYARNKAGWFFAGGQTGCGKSHICTAICRSLFQEGMAVKYMLWRDEVVTLKAVVTDSAEYARLIRPYKEAKVLYIDDLFKTGKDKFGKLQTPTVGDVNIAFEILNYRYNDPQKLTIISSECTMDELVGIDEAVAGRIFEKAQEYSVSIGKDIKKNWRFRGGVTL